MEKYYVNCPKCNYPELEGNFKAALIVPARLGVGYSNVHCANCGVRFSTKSKIVKIMKVK